MSVALAYGSSAVTRKKILVSAYACGPGRGSEPGIGWNATREIARRHDVWLITSTENRPAIEHELRVRPIPSLRVVFCDWPPWIDWVKRWRIGYELQHYAWQVKAYLEGRRLHRVIGFALVHHITLCRYWMPSFLALLPVPFFWGPVGGGESAPRPFWRGLGAKGAFLELTRECARWAGEHDPFLRLTARRTVMGLATTEESRKRMERLGVRALAVLSQLGLSDVELAGLARCRAPEAPPVRFISIGRLLHWKGFNLGLEAFAKLKASDTEYLVVGSGPALGSLQALARVHGISDRVRFCGEVSREETFSLLARAHVLVHPSLHESGGMVCLEAMAAGKPVICLDLGGPALQVTASTGFKVSAEHPDDAIAEMAVAMGRLAASSELRKQMGEAGRARASRDFNWRTKSQNFDRLYAEVTGGTGAGTHDDARSPG